MGKHRSRSISLASLKKAINSPGKPIVTPLPGNPARLAPAPAQAPNPLDQRDTALKEVDHSVASRGTKVTISRADAFKVAFWMQKNEIFLSTHDWDQIRTEIMAELKLDKLSLNTVQNIAHDLGFTVAAKTAATLGERVTFLERKNTDLQTRLEKLETLFAVRGIP